MKKKSIEKLEALYKSIPEIECKGLCHPSCSIVPAEDIEMKRARKKLSYNPFRVSNKDLEEAKTTGQGRKRLAIESKDKAIEVFKKINLILNCIETPGREGQLKHVFQLNKDFS